MPFRALRGFNLTEIRADYRPYLCPSRNALPGIEGIQPPAEVCRAETAGFQVVMPFRALRGFNLIALGRVRSVPVLGRNALPGIEGIQPGTSRPTRP